MTHTSTINAIAWSLAVSGAIAFIASGAGVVYFAALHDQRTSSEIADALHDTYYIIHRSKAFILPLLLCMALSAAVTIIGYSLTTHHIVRTLQDSARSEPKT